MALQVQWTDDALKELKKFAQTDIDPEDPDKAPDQETQAKINTFKLNGKQAILDANYGNWNAGTNQTVNVDYDGKGNLALTCVRDYGENVRITGVSLAAAVA
ncbi:MAG: hypothetical protein A3H96_11825 [Acidobacteria bacterium RIFCSPLOWO2_02_FULL_67_36]|nr:MAG: hypothetical protein A3H96_11825 [Acidobacteria bacterium RIFCSPLOWO2_02_FULL_67_36]OFW22389.1 MAG: hypothetical protein A3G21_21385 [Acidobacteria bacterium RIFCSPLOWO2_12_FULL_66_21]